MDPRRSQTPLVDSSKKGKLSYVLNNDDDGIMPSQSGLSNLHAGRSSGFGMLNGPSNENLGGYQLFQQRPQGESPNGSSSTKNGVRKKRQRKFICDVCNFGFYTNSDLQKHVSSVHLLLRPYPCTACDKKFGERSNATKHFKSVHERQKNAICDQCNKVFAFRDGLVRHVRLVHENIRNFHCQYPGCGQSFKQSAHLKKHEQVHNRKNGGTRVHRGSSSARR